MKLLEMYPAIQGEGILTGVPSTFIRLSGCTVGCSWCDTKYSWKAAQGEDVNPDEIYRRAKEMTTHSHVVLTGGEPLEHPELDIIELIRLLQTQFHVTIETSGTNVDPRLFVVQTRVWENILWSVAPKLGSARSKKPFPDLSGWQEAARQMDHKLQLKFVIANQSDFQEALEVLADSRLSIDPAVTTPILQVATGIGNLDAIRSTVLEDLRALQEQVVEKRLLIHVPNLRVLPQLHAVIYGNKRGI